MPEQGPDLEQVFALQRAVTTRPAPSKSDRGKSLRVLESLVNSNRRQIQEAVTADFGCRASQETYIAEIVGSINSLRYARRHLGRWMRPRRRSTGIWYLPGSNRVIPQPKGVVGIMAPWNYPIHLVFAPLAAAIAAGNRVMIKMSELTPNTAALISERIAENFDTDQIWVTGGDADEAKAFSNLPFDHLLFTGSTAVGRHVMAAAAANLTPVTLELGGKSPVLVDGTYPIERAAERVAWGKLFNASQTCVAPDYVLVPSGSAGLFSEAILEATAKLYPDSAGSEDYTSIIDADHLDRLNQLVKDATAKGAKLVQTPMPAGDHGKFPLSLLLNTTADMRVQDEEIFGPILPIIEYDTPAQAISYINARPRPLALYLFTENAGFRRRVLTETVSGGVTVNDTLLHYLQDDLPFGGSGASGMGSYHGREGFDTFSHLKGVFQQRDLAGRTGAQLLYPPYGHVADALVRMMRKL